MSNEKLSEIPKTPEFIARSYAEKIADDSQMEFNFLSEGENFWEGQILRLDEAWRQQRTSPSEADSRLFMWKLIEFLDDDFPEHDWQNMLSVVEKEDTYRIHFQHTTV